MQCLSRSPQWLRRGIRGGAALALTAALTAQTPVRYPGEITASPYAIDLNYDSGAAALHQALKRLHTRASLIMVTAHPDDEDGGMLAWNSRGVGARVALLTLNRGEGGANVMSPDYFDALGLVRTQELLQAGRYYGVDQYWTRVIDYGFSKTLDESLSKWTKDRVLYDVVRVIRLNRPLVISSVFVGGPSDGHGNHQTAGLMAKEAYKMAGDPNVFPEQIRAGLRPWTPLKDYERRPFRRAQGADAMASNISVPQGTYNPLLGRSYTQVSREGLALQKSQNGGGTIPAAGPIMSDYHRVAARMDAKDKEESFFDGIDVSLAGIATLAPDAEKAPFLKESLATINKYVEQALAQFSATSPDAVAAMLAAGLKETNSLMERVRTSALSEQSKYDLLHELRVKQGQFNEALVQSLGLAMRATVAPEREPNPMFAMFMGEPDTFRVAIPGQSFGVKVRVASQGGSAVQLNRLSIRAEDPKSFTIADAHTPGAGPLTSTKAVDVTIPVKVNENAAYTRPYFTRPDLEQPYYDINDERYLNQPLAPYPLEAWADFTYEGVPVRLGQVVQTTRRSTGYGPVFEPLVIGPGVSIAISPRVGVVPFGVKSFPVTAVVRSNVKGAAKGKVKLDLPEGWKAVPATADFSTVADGDEQSVQFTVTPAQLTTKEYRITAVAELNGKEYREGYASIGYPGLRPYALYRPSTYRVSGVDVKVAPGLRVGYITGSGDEVPASLEHLGIKTSFLSTADLSTGDLAKFDVILLGVRTYAARDELRTYNSRLLEYVKNGGVAIVQYNTPEFDHNFGPYPYTMTSNPEEVTDEASQVTILKPENPIFNWPNKISAKDFEGWVEERGSKWMKTWDPRYEALLETHDKDQEPQQGGLLYAKYGKGIYVYDAYAFYRQLPEGVSGAYRIFANIVSLPKNPNR